MDCNIDIIGLLLDKIYQEKKRDKEWNIGNFCFNSLVRVVDRLCVTETAMNGKLVEYADLKDKMKRENYLLHDNILSSSRIKDNWINYKENLMQNALPLVVSFLCKDAENDQIHDTLLRVLATFEKSSNNYKQQQDAVEFGNHSLLNTICDNFVAHGDSGMVTVVDVLNSPYIWKHLLKRKSFGIFTSLMEQYIQHIDLTRLSERNLIERRKFDLAYKLLVFTESKMDNQEESTQETAVHPIYGFFALTCLWGVTLYDFEKYKHYLSKMVNSVLYPNVKIFSKFYQNNDNSITNMKETYQLFCNIYKHIDDLNHGKFYNDSDIWTNDTDNLDQFEEFVRDTMCLRLFVPSAEISVTVASQTKMRPKSKSVKVIRNVKSTLINQMQDNICSCHWCNCDRCLLCCEELLDVLFVVLKWIFCGLCLCCYWCVCCYKRNKKKVQNVHIRGDRKVLMLGIDDVGKATFAKQIRDIYPSEKEIGEQKMEPQWSKGHAKNVIRVNLISEMATLISKAIMYHHSHPQEFMAPTFPQTYVVDDEKAPDGQYIVNIKEVVETIVNLSKDMFDDIFGYDADSIINNLQESDEYWNVLGVYIRAAWEQPWIQAIYSKRKGLYSLIANIGYFFDKSTQCMSPDYKVSDEDYLRLGEKTHGVISRQFLYIDANEFKAETTKPYKINLIYGGGRRYLRKGWIHFFDRVSTMIYFCALNHYCEILFEEDAKNAMWEALDLFHDILDGKWFRHSTVVIFLNRQDLFRQSILEGHQLKDCFDGDANIHPNAEWPGAYDQVNKYKDIEWNQNEHFEAKDGRTQQEIADIYFENVIDTQIEFIKQVFLGIADYHNRKRNVDVFIHTTTAIDKDQAKKVFDTAMMNSFSSDRMLGLM